MTFRMNALTIDLQDKYRVSDLAEGAQTTLI